MPSQSRRTVLPTAPRTRRWNRVRAAPTPPKASTMIVRRLGLVLVVALLPSIPSVSIKIAGIRAPGSDGKTNVIPGRTSSPSVKPAELAVRLDERCKRRVDVRADMAGAINGRRHFWAEKGAAVFEDLDGELNDHFLGAFLGVLKKRRSADGVLATIAYALETQALALNERHWTLALKACRRAGQWQRALELLDLKEASGFALELLDFNLVIATCATASIVSAEQFRAASALIARLEAAGFAPDVETFEPLLRALNMAGRGEAALELFGEMRRAGIEHTPVTYSHLVCAQQISGDPVACLAAFDAMNMEGVEPDQAAYRAALDASIQSGDEERAREIAAAGVALWNWDPDAGLAKREDRIQAQLRRREAEFFEVPVSKTPMSMEVLREVFDAIDTDGSGYIETGEIEALMEQLDSRELNGKPSAGEVQKFIKFFDANDDGVVSFQEFVDSFLVTWPLAGEGE